MRDVPCFTGIAIAEFRFGASTRHVPALANQVAVFVHFIGARDQFPFVPFGEHKLLLDGVCPGYTMTGVPAGAIWFSAKSHRSGPFG